MLFQTPPITQREAEVVAEIEAMRRQWEAPLPKLREWPGLPWRETHDRVVGTGQEETPVAESYRAALGFVLQLADAPDFRYDEGLFRALHFLMLRHDPARNPGHWRRSSMLVARQERFTAFVDYRAPDFRRVPGLIAELIAELVGSTTWAYAPRFYEPDYHADGTLAAMNRTRSDVPREIMACTISKDFDDFPLPRRPVVSLVQTPHDRIAIEIMRGCPWQCRFCQSTVIKRPMRFRTVETIVNSALEAYRNTGTNEISLLSLSSSDYPHFEELVRRMHEVFTPRGVNVSLPSLRINLHRRSLPSLIKGVRRGGLTLARGLTLTAGLLRTTATDLVQLSDTTEVGLYSVGVRIASAASGRAAYMPPLIPRRTSTSRSFSAILAAWRKVGRLTPSRARRSSSAPRKSPSSCCRLNSPSARAAWTTRVSPFIGVSISGASSGDRRSDPARIRRGRFRRFGQPVRCRTAARRSDPGCRAGRPRSCSCRRTGRSRGAGWSERCLRSAGNPIPT